ncbi:VOC family protein [Kibdelosporangium aridum]|uniref:VOC family protein n=1 Tax=Kibdelosporangium aridum TaxID=2030 RepID=UPI0035EA2402
MFHLDHLCLGVRDLNDGVRRVREETGLAHYDGGAFAASIANTIFPLGGDAYLEVEAVMATADKRDEGGRLVRPGRRGRRPVDVLESARRHPRGDDRRRAAARRRGGAAPGTHPA